MLMHHRRIAAPMRARPGRGASSSNGCADRQSNIQRDRQGHFDFRRLGLDGLRTRFLRWAAPDTYALAARHCAHDGMGRKAKPPPLLLYLV